MMQVRVDDLAVSARQLVADFIAALEVRLGDRLEAGVVSGDATSPAFERNRSSLSVLLLVRAVDQGTLDAVSQTWQRMREVGFEPPLVLTRSELSRSLDAYPVEFLGVKLTGAVVSGDFDLNSLKIPFIALRLQCERELRGLSIHCRLAYLRFRHSEGDLGAMLASGAGRMLAILRSAAVTVGEDGGGTVEAVLAALQGHFGEKVKLLGDLFSLTRERKPKRSAAWLLELSALLDEMVEKVDRVEAREGTA